MEWATCVKRQTVEILNRTGDVGESHRCTHRSCVSFAQALTPETCAQCPLRVKTENIRPSEYKEEMVTERDFGQPIVDGKGLLIYPRTGWEPPVVPAGYKRLDEDIRSPGAWMFIPEWPACEDREMANTVRPCGCLQINAMCASKDSEKRGLKIAVTDCVNCPVRRYAQ